MRRACRLPLSNKLAQYRADDAAHSSEACTKYTAAARGLTKGERSMRRSRWGLVGCADMLRPPGAAHDAGILGMYCPHGICIAFTILTRHEGPSAAFELLVTHFKQAPAVIVYDNVSERGSCRGHTQQLNPAVDC